MRLTFIEQELFSRNSRPPSPRPSPPMRGRTFSSAGQGSPASDFSQCCHWCFPAHEARSGGHPACRRAGASSPAVMPCQNSELSTHRDSCSGRQDAGPLRQAGCPPLRFKGAKRAKSPENSLLRERARVRASHVSDCMVTANSRRVLQEVRPNPLAVTNVLFGNAN